MRTQKFLSAMLALAIMLSCIGWTPTRAEAATLDNGAGTVTENIQPQTSAEGIDILQSEAAQTHVARLRGEEQENLNQQIFLNQDGSKTMYIYDHPVKYRDEQGEIYDISLDIADTGDAAYPYRTRANSTVTAFPAELSAGITLSGNGVSLRLAAQMPAGSTAGTTELVNHRVQRVDEQKVAYRYDADTTIEYALTYTGFKEDIVVNRYTGQTEYNFILYTNGLTLTQIGGGHYLTDESGEIRASIGQIIVFTADERNNTFGQLVATTIKENQIYGMTIVLDADYLADPETKYPIRIDPTVSLTYADSGPDAIEDVVIQSKNEPLPQYGASVIGLPNKGISRLLVRFPGIDFAALEGVTVTSAALSIRDLMCEVEVMNVTCYPYTGTPWTETTAHWNTLNQSWGTALSSHDISYYDGLEQPRQFWYDFDFTALAQQWVDGTADEDLGIILKASDAVEQDDEYLYKTFSSYERDSYKTYFTLTYRSSITLNRSTADVDVGDTLQLIATTIPEGEPVSWQSSDNTIATVSNTGIVTGIKTGQVTITATCEDCVVAASCVVYVTVADGVYYIEHAQTGFVLQTDGTVNTINNSTNNYYHNDPYNSVFINKRHSTNADIHTQARQLWKIKHIENGRYTIRPLNDLRSSLENDGGIIRTKYDSENHRDSNIGGSILNSWTFETYGSRYYFQYFPMSSAQSIAYLYADATANRPIEVTTETTKTLNALWTLTPITQHLSGFFLYSTTTSALIAQSLTLNLNAGNTYEWMRDHKLLIVVYDTESISQNITWYSLHPNVASVDAASGTITALSTGFGTIIGTSESGATYHISFNVQLDGIYFLRNKHSQTYATTAPGSGTISPTVFQWTDNQMWEFKKNTEGYYTIRVCVPHTSIYMSADISSTESGKSIKLNIYDDIPQTQWSVSVTESGAYRLTPRSDTTGALALSMYSAGETPLNDELRQKTYTADDSFEDEWEIVPYRNLHLQVYFDENYQNQYTNEVGAIAEITPQLEIARTYFWEKFCIYITYDTPCIKVSPSSVSSIEDIVCNNQNSVFGNNAAVYYADWDSSGVGITNPEKHIVCIESDSGADAHLFDTVTLLHELGHLFAPNSDHYGLGYPSSNDMSEAYTSQGLNFSRKCIYGEDNGTEYVMENLLLCPGCHGLITLGISTFPWEAN